MSSVAHSRRLRIDAYTMLGASVVARGGLLVTQILTVRILGIEEFNLFVTASVVGSIIYTVSDLGLTQAALVGAHGDAGIAAGATGQFRRLRIVTAAASALLGLLVVVLVVRAPSGEEQAAATAILLTYAIQSLSYFWRTPLLAATQVLRESRIMVAERTLSVAAGIVVLVVFESLVLMALAALGGAALGLLMSARSTPSPEPGRRLQWNRSAAKWGVRFSAALAATTIYARLDYLVIAGTQAAADAAMYAAAYSLVIAAAFLPMALTRSTFVHYPAGGEDAMRTHLLTALAIGCAGGLGIALLGPATVEAAYGLDHPRLGDVCALLGAAFLLMALNSGVLVAEAFQGSEHRLLALTSSALVVNAILCAVLITEAGVIGGAIATVATEAWVAVAWRVSRRRAGLGPAAETRQLRATWAQSG